MENNSRSSIFIFLLIFLITINLFLLDVKIFMGSSGIKISNLASVTIPSSTPTQTFSGQDQLLCPMNCIALIKQATGSTQTAIGAPFRESAAAAVTPLTTTKEYYIPLGSGNTDKSDWYNLVATETVIDPASYGTIKEAYFIASFRNPTQNGMVEAQLYNVTDKHPVWGSHVIMNGPPSQTITSSKITLDNGNKLYRVQLKSTMNYLVYLDNAKIRIITE